MTSHHDVAGVVAEQHDAHVRTYHAHMQWQRIRSRHRRYRRANYIGLNPW